MLSINATLTQPATGTTVATIGDENTFVTLTMRRLGAVIELVTGLTIYFGLSGHYEYEELAREFADDEDEAVEIATDLEYSAANRLRIMDVDFWKEPTGFPEALILAFDAAHAAHAIAAE
jgi:hypothetical protein